MPPRRLRRIGKLGGSDFMFSKILLVLAATSIAALAMRLLDGEEREDALEREVVGQLNALREHLFKR